MNSIIFIIRFILLIPLFLASTSAMAQQWYHVEMIVFENVSGANTEHWPQMNDIRSGNLSPLMANEQIQPARVETLIGVVQRLQNNANYQVLYHKAWQQPILNKRNAPSIQITSDDGLVMGAIKIFRINHLNAELDLWLNENNSAFNSLNVSNLIDNSNLETSGNPNLSEIRRIKPKELIYFDHPRIAALLQLTPVDAPVLSISGSDTE